MMMLDLKMGIISLYMAVFIFHQVKLISLISYTNVKFCDSMAWCIVLSIVTVVQIVTWIIFNNVFLEIIMNYSKIWINWTGLDEIVIGTNIYNPTNKASAYLLYLIFSKSVNDYSCILTMGKWYIT